MESNNPMLHPEWERIKQIVISNIIQNHPNVEPHRISFEFEGENIGLFYDGERKGEMHYGFVNKKDVPILNNITLN